MKANVWPSEPYFHVEGQSLAHCGSSEFRHSVHKHQRPQWSQSHTQRPGSCAHSRGVLQFIMLFAGRIFIPTFRTALTGLTIPGLYQPVRWPLPSCSSSIACCSTEEWWKESSSKKECLDVSGNGEDNEILLISLHPKNAIKRRRIHLLKWIIVPVGQTFTDPLPSVLNSLTPFLTMRLPTEKVLIQ